MSGAQRTHRPSTRIQTSPKLTNIWQKDARFRYAVYGEAIMVNRQPLSHRNVHAKSSDCCRSRTVNEDSPMRNLLTLSAAASLLAIGMSAHHAAALSPGANSISPQGLVLKVQKSDEKGPPTRDGGKSGESGARGQDGGGKGAGPSATQEKGSDRGADARATKVRAVRRRTNVAMSKSMSAEGAPTETEQTGARGWMSMSIAGADPADGMSTSTCGAMGIPPLAAKSCCVATSNAPPADTFCSGAPEGAPLSFSR